MLLKYYCAGTLECGIDESGTGPGAGPVYAGAVIWPPDVEDCPENQLLNDSKKLTDNQRRRLKGYIEATAIDFAVGSVDVDTINDINILNAKYLAMHRAIGQLNVVPELLIVDGDKFKKYPDPYTNITGANTDEFIPHVLVV